MESTPCHRSSTVPDPAHSGSAHRCGTTWRGRVGRKLSKAFNTSSAVRQGCVLAPALFCLAIDWIMSRCSGSLGVTLGEAVFTDLNYADEKLLFAQDLGRWQAELKRFNDVATTMGLPTSWAKTKNAVTVLLLNQFKLTDTLWRSLTWVCLSGQHYWLLWLFQCWYSSTTRPCIFNDGSVRLSLTPEPTDSRSTKLIIYTTCVLAVGAEDSRRLQAFHMTCQRRILWNNFITNRAVRGRQEESSEHTQQHSRPSSFHFWPQHTSTQATVNARSGDNPHHSWNFCCLLTFFHKRVRFFNQFLHTCYTLRPIYARLQIFIQLSPTLTKLCHIKREQFT